MFVKRPRQQQTTTKKKKLWSYRSTTKTIPSDIILEEEQEDSLQQDFLDAVTPRSASTLGSTLDSSSSIGQLVALCQFHQSIPCFQNKDKDKHIVDEWVRTTGHDDDDASPLDDDTHERPNKSSLSQRKSLMVGIPPARTTSLMVGTPLLKRLQSKRRPRSKVIPLVKRRNKHHVHYYFLAALALGALYYTIMMLSSSKK